MLLALLLAAATFEVTSYGAVPDDGISDSAAFRATFAAGCAGGGAGDVVHAGAGTWDLERIDTQSAVYVEACDGITFRGEGLATSLKAFGGTHVGDYYLLYFIISDGVTLEDFACDGNRSAMVSSDEQTHCIVETNCEDFTLQRATLSHSWGDGIKLVGDPATNARINLLDLTMDDNGRSGIAVHAAADVLIERFTGTNIDQSCVDTEPGGGLGIEGLTLRDSSCVEAGPGRITMSFSGGTGPGGTQSTDFLVQNVDLEGCADSLQIERIVFDNVRFHCPSGDALHFGRDAQHVTIRHSAFSAEGANAALSFVADDEVDNITLENVRLTVQDGSAFSLEGGGGAVALTNVRMFSQSSWAQGTGVQTNTNADTPNMVGLAFDVDIRGLRMGVGIGRRALFAATVPAATVTGTITARTGADTYGLFCSNGAPASLANSATIAAATPVLGCP